MNEKLHKEATDRRSAPDHTPVSRSGLEMQPHITTIKRYQKYGIAHKNPNLIFTEQVILYKMKKEMRRNTA